MVSITWHQSSYTSTTQSMDVPSNGLYRHRAPVTGGGQRPFGTQVPWRQRQGGGSVQTQVSVKSSTWRPCPQYYYWGYKHGHFMVTGRESTWLQTSQCAKISHHYNMCFSNPRDCYRRPSLGTADKTPAHFCCSVEILSQTQAQPPGQLPGEQQHQQQQQPQLQQQQLPVQRPGRRRQRRSHLRHHCAITRNASPAPSAAISSALL